MANKRAFPVKLSDKQKEYINGLRYLFSDIFDYLEAVEREIGRSRELSIGFTKLEECQMWVNRAVAQSGTTLEGEA